MTIKMKPFSQGDWCAFHNADRFADGSEPLVGSMGIYDRASCMHRDATVILDERGLAVFFEINDEGTTDEYIFKGTLAARALAMLTHGMDLAELKALPGCIQI